MGILKNALLGILATIVAVAVCVGLWFGGWALYKANVAQEREVNHTSQQWQDATVAAERARIQGYDASTSDAQKKQIKSTFCAIYVTIQNPPADLAVANARICN